MANWLQARAIQRVLHEVRKFPEESKSPDTSVANTWNYTYLHSPTDLTFLNLQENHVQNNGIGHLSRGGFDCRLTLVVQN